ncbi:hypothetical protein [Streptomyces cavernicola]|uniref:Aromatic ring-opening dioxygenase LigA n=1 Tax=Streptomyces cavernicola TaxID=3043613 RepID=A0ABT6S9Q9_9ACTN|nr:hypothetical protein [Streptomyces sp. B-S-A6]MDI3404877.1 hypothetical protein [Streptomyces sp. B-S-A6]
MTQLTVPVLETPRPGRFLKGVRALAILACLPYVTLKVAWIAGSRVGIPDHSSLLDHPTAMAVANGLTVLMDIAVVVLALLLTRPWGLRVRAWLLVLPLWVATGLLAPILAGFPLQLLVRTFGGSTATAGGRSTAFLDEWVFGVVYGGFIVQGLALGVLAVAYAGRRWGRLWQGAVRDLPAGLPTAPAQRAAATAAALLTLVPAALHALWGSGSAAGLNASRAAGRTSDFYALEWMHVGFAAATAAGVLMLAFRRGGTLPLRVPLALAWVGSGALACWGGWMTLAALTGVDDLSNQPSGLLHLTYAVQMIVGTLVVAVGAYFFAERSAAVRRTG